MAKLSEIIPTARQRVIDLVAAAGMDVSDWGNFKGGKEKAASNPKYCYEWSFIEAKKLVVLNLWYASMQERDATIFQDLNLREVAHRYGREPRKPAWERRSRNMDLAIQAAVRDKLPIRVVICDGEMRDIENDDSEPSRVEKRLLDPIPWAVTAYDWNNGACTVTRGATPDRFVDQFSVSPESTPQPERRMVTGEEFVRNPNVRRRALLRANGVCEWCAQPGFAMTDGRIFLETHHVIPLAEGGPDTEDNVVALCPNHHREVHHGANGPEMRKHLLARASHRRAAEPCLAGDAPQAARP